MLENEGPARETPDPDTPFQILVIGDFSGRANRGLHASMKGRRTTRVDVDNLDDAVAEFGAALELPDASLRFRELDDFHPDHIYRNAASFRELEESRHHPPRGQATAAPKPSAAAAPAPPPARPGMSLLDQMMEADQPATTARSRPGDTLANFIEQAVAPTLVKKDPTREQWSAQVDAMAAERMAAVLHHPQFQALEGAWRGVEFLVRRLDPDGELRIHLLDATLAELLEDPQATAECMAGSRQRWAVIVGIFGFGQSAEDEARLRILGRLAAAVGAPFLAEGQPPDGQPNSDWAALRKSAEGRWIGLALPRFLLRLPYGKATSEVESFAFEEMPESVHRNYLWGNPGFACACRLGEAFRNEGWQLRPGRGQIAGLPLHVYKVDRDSVAKPCAEVLLSERDAEFLLDNGMIPLASVKDQDAIVLLRIQSIADPVAPLAGRW